jgi:phosphinothricin acetyltransferase
MNTSSANIRVRPSEDADVAAICAIYSHAVLQSTGTFETEAPSPAEIAGRRDEVLARGLPWLVAESNGEVLGYAYANQFRPRKAYRFCVEDSVYLHPKARGQGLGRILLAELLRRCEALGMRQIIAVIGDSDNLASIGLHRSLGFEHTGLIRNAGWKFDRWLDVVMMQKQLGLGASADPIEVKGNS